MSNNEDNATNLEQHWKPSDLARKLRMDVATVRRLLRNEPGVLRFHSGTRTSLRIPQSVLETFQKRIVVTEEQGIACQQTKV